MMKIDNDKQWVINKNHKTKDWVIGIKFGTGVDAFVINYNSFTYKKDAIKYINNYGGV